MTVDVETNPGVLPFIAITFNERDEVYSVEKLEQKIKQEVTSKPITQKSFALLFNNPLFNAWFISDGSLNKTPIARQGLYEAADCGFEIMLASMLEAVPASGRLAAITEPNSKGKTVIELALSSPNNVNTVLSLLQCLSSEDELLVVLKYLINQLDLLTLMQIIFGILPYLTPYGCLSVITHRNNKSDTLLHLLADYGILENIKALLADLPADQIFKALCTLNNNKQTPLHVAASKDYAELLDMLLRYLSEKHRDLIIGMQDVDGHTALDHAIAPAEKEAIEGPIENAINQSIELEANLALETLLYYTSEAARFRITTTPNVEGMTAFERAIYCNDLEAINIFLAYMPKAKHHQLITMLASDERSMLHLAAEYNEEAFKLLFKHLPVTKRIGSLITKNKQGSTVLGSLIQLGNLSNIKTVLKLLPAEKKLVCLNILKQNKRLKSEFITQAKQGSVVPLYLAVAVYPKAKRIAALKKYLPVFDFSSALKAENLEWANLEILKLLPGGELLYEVHLKTQINLETLWQNKAQRLQALTETFKTASYEDCLKWLEELTRQPNNLFNEHHFARIDTVFRKTYTRSYSKTLQQLREITFAKLQEELAADKQNQKRLLINALKSTAFTKPRGNYFFTGAYSSTRSEKLIRQEAVKVSEISSGVKEVAVKNEPNVEFYRFQLW